MSIFRVVQHGNNLLAEVAGWHRGAKALHERLGRDAGRPCIGAGARIARPGTENHLARHDHLEADSEVPLLRDGVGIFGHEPEHALGAGIAARHRRSIESSATRSHEDATFRLERQVERRLEPIEPGLYVALPWRCEIRPAHLIQPAHPRRHAGVQHQDVRVDLSKDALRGGLLRHVGRNCGGAQPGCDGGERIGVASNDSDPGTMRNQGFDESQAKTTASAGDDDILIFEAHELCSAISILDGAKTIETRKRSQSKPR